MAITRALLVAVVAAFAAVAVSTAVQAAPVGGGCTIRYVYFDVRSITLDERVAAHWEYTGANSFDAPGAASIDTVQVGSVDFRHGPPSAAERSRYEQIATFQELSGNCRIGDRSQGKVHASAVGVRYQLSGTWTAGERSGSCSDDKTADRPVKGNFIRRSLSLSPSVRKVGFTWLTRSPPTLNCDFMAFDSSTGEYAATSLGSYALAYGRDRHSTMAKSKLLRRRVIRIPISVRRSIDQPRPKQGTGWQVGSMRATMTLTGSVTLRRYKSCKVTPATDLRKTRCIYP